MNRKKIFSIPFNGDLDLMRWAIDSGQVREIYFSSTMNYGLSLKCDKSPKKHNETKINELLKLCHKHNIEANLLVNQISLMYTNMSSCLRYIKNLPYLSAITLGDPHAAEFFVSNFPALDIQASIIMNLYSANRIETMLKKGIGTISLPNEYSRDSDGLKKISLLKTRFKKFKIKLFISNICYSDCPFTVSHFAMRFNKTIKPPTNKTIICYSEKDNCEIKADRESLIKRPFVRPEDLEELLKTGWVDYFKLIYRFDESTVLRKKMSAYFERKFVGNLFEIIPYPHSDTSSYRVFCDNKKFPKEFFKTVFHCNKNCFKCSYCYNIAKKVLSSYM